MTPLLTHLSERVDAGAKLLIPYVMTGLPDRASFPEAFAAVAEHADVVELGLAYSDPLMDGPVIAAAGERALREGIGPRCALGLAGELPAGVPRVVMTYYNPIHKLGEDEFCRLAADAGVAGLIVPDIPIEESSGLRSSAAEHGLAWIPLVAPTSSRERVEAIAATATGFVYAVSTLGVTGTRTSLSERASAVVAACREATDLPVCVGIGVSNAAQAVEAAEHADGVVVGSAVVATLLENGAESAGALVAELRSALDKMSA